MDDQLTETDRSDPSDNTDEMDPEALYHRINTDQSVRLLDVRDRDAVEAWRIDGPSVTFTQLPSSEFLQAEVTDSVAELATQIHGEGPITVVCAEGKSSAYVAKLLSQAGFDAHNLADGMAGWARLYRASEVGTSPMVVQYHRPSSGCLGYMVIDDDEAVVVDPLRAFTERYVTDVADRGAEIIAVIDTHLHADHISGLRTLVESVDAPGYLPPASVKRGVTYDIGTVDDGDTINVGSTSLIAVALPGHTTGMTGFAADDFLLSGDSIFLDGVARPDLQVEGTDAQADLASDLYDTIQDRLDAFDDSTVVAPGHVSDTATVRDDGQITRLGPLRDRLSLFGADKETFIDRILSDLPPQPANADRILAINMGIESVSAETAFELELGPNNCAAATWDG